MLNQFLAFLIEKKKTAESLNFNVSQSSASRESVYFEFESTRKLAGFTAWENGSYYLEIADLNTAELVFSFHGTCNSEPSQDKHIMNFFDTLLNTI